MAAALFVPVWTLNYWQAWVFLAVFFTSSGAITLYLMKNDPNLLQRRVRAGPLHEKETAQKTLQYIAQLAFLSIIIFSAIDHRLRWSNASPFISIAGDLFVGIGFYIVFLVFKENTFASALIEVMTDQKVVSTGPYAQIRHPMYTGALILLLGIPLALGSWWGILMLIPVTVIIILRLLDEEILLSKNLRGYEEYKRQVQQRLVPFVW